MDDELIAAIASGDGDDTALRELFSRHAPWLAARLRKAALLESWTSPWTWPVRPPADRGAWLRACPVFAAGVVAFTIRGARTRLADDS